MKVNEKRGEEEKKKKRRKEENYFNLKESRW